MEKTKKYFDYLIKQPKGFLYQDAEKEKVTDKKEALEKLYAKYKKCKECPLSSQGRTQVVFGNGNPNTKLMFIGEGPGKDEDAQGEAFVGRAGKLLTKIITAMGFERKDLYISNVVKCRPPNNRTPLPQESQTCKKLILYKEINIIQPTIICTLGACATQALLGETSPISKIRGDFINFKDNILIMPTFHPAYLLRNPDSKKLVWQDMQKIIEKLTI